ncbi:MAG: AAA family ATPase [Nitrospinae bacterium]|jgi:general secretion pathway protein A|nr:AAA family ATPase [Nitrospinota bacterium]MDA1109521.1 AAA family ATPase [Nitrospinota bacterium]
MYENFYRFNEKPFSLTPDPRFLFLSKHHQGALDHMLYGISQREGFMAIVGDVGTGKTTLCRCLLDRLDNNIQVALILNPMLSDMDLLRTCVHDLEVKPISVFSEKMVSGNPSLEVDFSEEVDMNWVNRASKKELLDALNTFLLEQHRAGGSTVLIIDEAQNLPLDVMEQLRILSNLETEKEKLLQIIFVGQLELNDKLKSPELKQLNQRISIRYEIRPLSPEETVRYINHRLLVAGAGSRVSFKSSAVKEIFKYSQGYPRLINLVCDRALLSGYNDQVDIIDRPQVNQGIKSLLGEDEKNYYREHFIRFRLPVIVSALFFLAGLAFFVFAQMGIDWRSEFRHLKTKLGMAQSLSKKEIPLRRGSSDLESEAPMAARDQQGVLGNKAADSEKTPALEPTQTDGTEEVGNYRIQLYSLQEVSEAKEEVRKLREEGYKAYWKKAVTGDQAWYMVYVGPYKEAPSARIHVDALKFSGRNPILLSVSKSP